jgi:hypothetical protein
MLGTPGGKEHGGGLVAECTVQPALVIVGAPRPDDLACVGERSEPVLFQALAAAFARETFHISLCVGLLAGISRSVPRLR